jgi:hypothetical protein
MTKTLRYQLGEDLTWQYEARFSSMLSEFSRNKSSNILLLLQGNFVHQWDKTSIKKLPLPLKDELHPLAEMRKKQLLFTLPATEKVPTVIACWWPWEHGGTYSLRVKLLKESYNFGQKPATKSGLFYKFKALLSMS